MHSPTVLLMNAKQPHYEAFLMLITEVLILCVKRRSGMELLVSGFQETASGNLKLETCNLKRLDEIHFTKKRAFGRFRDEPS